MLTIVLSVTQERVLPHCAGSTLSNFCEVKALSISDNKSHLHTSVAITEPNYATR